MSSHLIVIVSFTMFSDVVCQSCDSYQCLRSLHNQLIDAQHNHTLACRAGEEYVRCVEEAGEDCTHLDLHVQRQAAVNLRDVSLCLIADMLPDSSNETENSTSAPRLAWQLLLFLFFAWSP